MVKYYLTTAIPYVNAKPHIGHAYEYFLADVVRRYYQLLNFETLLLSGADENALTNIQAAERENIPIDEFLNQNSKIFEETYKNLGVKLDVFQRGSDQKKHWPGVQKLWQLCNQNGDIYKKSYKGYYCVGCEAFVTEKELINDLCPRHNKKPELVEEENYFFKLSKYQNQLIQLIESNKLKITPDNKKAETLSFIKTGLEDFSISRSKERARGVGVPVPDDQSQIIYVWFDALDIYMTGIGFGFNEENWHKWWPADLHIIGKDINRFHTVYWPAMLLSANLLLPKQILIHGFINASGGIKMSKSLGNVVDPFEIINKYGLESLRYYLISQTPINNDGEFSEERLKEVYNSDLANGLGNLVARVAKMAEQVNLETEPEKCKIDQNVAKLIESFEFDKTLKLIWEKIKKADTLINEKQVWKLEGNEKKKILTDLVNQIRQIAFDLQIFLPQTAEKIQKQFKGPKIESQPPLFLRII